MCIEHNTLNPLGENFGCSKRNPSPSPTRQCMNVQRKLFFTELHIYVRTTYGIKQINLTYILLSLDAAPPVTLATRRAESSWNDNIQHMKYHKMDKICNINWNNQESSFVVRMSRLHPRSLHIISIINKLKLYNKSRNYFGSWDRQ